MLFTQVPLQDYVPHPVQRTVSPLGSQITRPIETRSGTSVGTHRTDRQGRVLPPAGVLLVAFVFFGATPAPAGWNTLGGNPQHTGVSAVASQPLEAIHWSTPVDLAPPAGNILIHYGSPLVTPANTVVVPIKTGSTDGYRVDARNGQDGSLIWSQTTDYILPPHNWTPSYAPALTASNRVYFAGAGGTVYFRDNVDSGGPLSIGQVAFFGLSNYAAAPASFNSTVFINTPITADAAGNIYFGFRTSGSAPLGLQNGIARIDANGNGTWISAVGASGGDTNITYVPHQAAPALSNDGQTLYVVVASDTANHYLVGLDPTSLVLKESSPGVKMRIALKDPRSAGANVALVTDDSSASPMVGPDGDVYYGVLGTPFNGSRGWMLHFSGDLTQIKTPGAFGWDSTASIVPASMVPSYSGASLYLIFTKYNQYAGQDGGDGVNKIAVLDPNDTMVEPHPSSNGELVMKEILTIAGPTPDPEFLSQFPNAVREWCINMAAVDPLTKSVMVNNEDGKLYRWDLATNTLSQAVALSPGIGEAYTPTAIGPDGTVYAINWAILNAVGKQPTISPTPTETSTAPTGTPTPTPTPTPTNTPTPTCVPGANNSIAGHIRYYSNGLPVSGATVLLRGPVTTSVQTDAAGQFAFTGFDGCDFHLEPQKLGDANNGVSALDASYVLQSVVGLRTLDAQQRLACDVTGNGAVSAFDGALILQQRVGLIGRFPIAVVCVSDWLFVPTPASVPNQQIIQPASLSAQDTCRAGAIELTPLAGQVDNQDFSAVLFGDCTGNWQPATPTPTATPF